MTNYAALKAEDAKVIYNGMTDAQRCGAMNVLTVANFVSIVPGDAQLALMFTNTVDWGVAG